MGHRSGERRLTGGEPAPLAGPRPGTLHVLVSQDTDPAANLACEELLLAEVEAGSRPDTLRIWVSDECVVRGRRRSRHYGWHDRELCRRLGIPIYQRTTAGGSVYHDRGNVNWSFYLKRDQGYVGGPKLFRACADLIVAALQDLGLEAAFAPPNRIDVAGRKVSGMASRASRGAVLVHGTLLVATDIDRLAALCVPPHGCPPVATLRHFDPRLTVETVMATIAQIAQNGATPGTRDAAQERPRS